MGTTHVLDLKVHSLELAGLNQESLAISLIPHFIKK